LKDLYKFFATGFGSGFSPIAPGTAGSIVAALILVGLNKFYPMFFPGTWDNFSVSLIFIIVFLLLGVWVSKELEKDWGKDPSAIVIDEMVGVWISMFLIPFTYKNLIAALIIFRFLDIVKPLYLKKLENLKNGWGVMMDDVVAGIYTNIIMHLIVIKLL